MARLQFDIQQLKGKSNSAALAKRAQALHEELASLNQETVEVDSIEAIAKHLTSNSLLLHKDRSVKAFIACCLADTLKLLAPDAPYSESELRDVFAFIFRQLKNLAKPNEAHHSQYAYLLDSLANAKSACLICELPGADEQISDIFKDFLSMVSSSDLSQSIRGCMTDILCQLLAEVDTIPQDSVDELLSRLLPKNAKAKTPSYHLAVSVFKHVAERLHRHVSAYFTDVFGQIQEALVEDGDADLDELATAHELIKELNRVAPQVLLNVIPQLEEQLQSDHLSLRMMATKSLGNMFAEHAGMLDHLARRYPSTWKSWLGRANDKDHTVRLIVLESLKPIWSAHPALVQSDLQRVLSDKLMDPDEKVRCAAAAVFSRVDLELILHHVDTSLLRKLEERIRDKKPSVGAEALKALGRLYNIAYPDIAGGDSTALEQLSWIPDVIIRHASSTPPVANVVEAVVLEYLLPLPNRVEEVGTWTDRFVFVYSSLSDAAQQSLLRLTHFAERRPSPYARYITACEENNGGIIDENEETKKRHLNLVIEYLSKTFPDPKKAREDLQKFAKMNENRLYKLLKTLMDPQTDLKTLLKTYPEALRRIESSASTVLETFKTFIRRASLLLINKSAIPHLLKKVSEYNDLDEGCQEAARVAETLLSFMAKRLAVMFSSYQDNLVLAADSEDEPRVVKVALMAASELKRVKAESFGEQIDFLKKSRQICFEGPHDQSKWAASLLALHDPDEASKMLEELYLSLSSLGEEQELARLVSINRLCRDLPPRDTATFVKISSILLEGVLGGRTTTENPSDDWTLDAELSRHCWTQIYGIKILGNLLKSISSQPAALGTAEPVLEFLWSALESSATVATKAEEATRLRLQASKVLLKLACLETYEATIIQHFQALSLMAQDFCFEVRQLFLRKLCAYLFARRLSNPIFNMILFMYAHDPEPENLAFVKQHVQGRLGSMPPDHRLHHFELLFIRFLHLLAHHPDFGRDVDELQLSARYIEFYLDCVATAENVSLLNHLTFKIRTVRDSASQGHSENVYVLAELAERIVGVIVVKNGWFVQTYPGKIKLPADIFKPLPSHDVQQDLARKSWLDPATIDEVLGSLSISRTAGKRKADHPDKKPKSKRRKPTPSSDQEQHSTKPSAGRAKKPGQKLKAAADEDAYGSDSAEDSAGRSAAKEDITKRSRKRPKPKPKGKAQSTRRSGRRTQAVNYASDDAPLPGDSADEPGSSDPDE